MHKNKIITSLIPTLKINSVARIGLDKLLKTQFKRLKKGTVLDVGSKTSPYKKIIPHDRYLRLDIDASNKPDICCDLHLLNSHDNSFDTIIATEVLEHLYDPQKAIDNIHKTLKKDGTCILSTRFAHEYHPGPFDYYRFSSDGLKHLFRNFDNVEIFHHGNRLHVIWMLINSNKYSHIFLNIFNPIIALINVKKTNWPCGFVVVAKK